MKGALLLLPAVLIVAAGGYALCAATGWWFESQRMVVAMSTALVSGLLAFVPLVLTRGASQPAVIQAGLVGTLVHLFGCLAGAAVLVMMKTGIASVYWILAFYWATLTVLVVSFSRVVRKAPPAANAGGFPVTPKQ